MNRTRRTGWLPAAALALMVGPASAASPGIYRCGQTYQQVPCPGGEAVDAADARTAAQRQDARAAASTEQRQARSLATERRAREKAAPLQTAPMGIAAPRAEEAASAVAESGKKKRKKKRTDEPPRLWVPPAG